MALAFYPHQCAGLERLEIECADIELPGELGIRRQQNLEAAVEEEAVDDVGAHATADAIRCFEYHD
jgi:hypothetical protein